MRFFVVGGMMWMRIIKLEMVFLIFFNVLWMRILYSFANFLSMNINILGMLFFVCRFVCWILLMVFLLLGNLGYFVYGGMRVKNVKRIMFDTLRCKFLVILVMWLLFM